MCLYCPSRPLPTFLSNEGQVEFLAANQRSNYKLLLKFSETAALALQIRPPLTRTLALASALSLTHSVSLLNVARSPLTLSLSNLLPRARALSLCLLTTPVTEARTAVKSNMDFAFGLASFRLGPGESIPAKAQSNKYIVRKTS
jgi:hypothetical protein